MPNKQGESDLEKNRKKKFSSNKGCKKNIKNGN